MRYPLDSFTITQGFYPVALPDHPFHGGIDLAAPEGTPIKSPTSGIVIAVGTDPNYEGGLYVIVRENASQHREFYMGHCSETLVRIGQSVNEGQVIAKVGQTGNATGPHVHFQIRKYSGGDLLNPINVINGITLASAGGSVNWQAEAQKATQIADERLDALNIKDQEIADRDKEIARVTAIAEDRLKSINILQIEKGNLDALNVKVDQILTILKGNK